MAYNFPSSPSIGQASNGYIWDGEKWIAAAGGGITQVDADARYVNVTGDTMTGPLTATGFTLTANTGSSYAVSDRLGVAANNWAIYADNSALRFYSPAGDQMTLGSVNGELVWNGAPWTNYTPTLVWTSGAGITAGRYKRLGKTCAITFYVNCSTTGAISSASIPFAAASGLPFVLVGRENATTGSMWQGLINPGATAANMYNYTNQNAMGAGASVLMSGVYETA